MIAMTLAQAATAMSGDLRDATDDIVLDTVVTDSREAGPGALFIAVVGRPTTVTITSPRHWVQGVSRRSSAVRCPVRTSWSTTPLPRPAVWHGR